VARAKGDIYVIRQIILTAPRLRCQLFRRSKDRILVVVHSFEVYIMIGDSFSHFAGVSAWHRLRSDMAE